MSDLDDLDDIYEANAPAAGKPAHSSAQARMRRQFSLRPVGASSIGSRVKASARSRTPAITLAKVNLPELPEQGRNVKPERTAKTDDAPIEI
jgi:hypothetical protein